jgi:hypothetical protein
VTRYVNIVLNLFCVVNVAWNLNEESVTHAKKPYVKLNFKAFHQMVQ